MFDDFWMVSPCRRNVLGIDAVSLQAQCPPICAIVFCGVLVGGMFDYRLLSPCMRHARRFYTVPLYDTIHKTVIDYIRKLGSDNVWKPFTDHAIFQITLSAIWAVFDNVLD
jgi:hypothetical protein